MAKIVGKPRIDIEFTFTVNEAEARALEALAGYGDDAFIGMFYDKLGASYLKPHEAGMREFLKSIRGICINALADVADARIALKRRDEVKTDKCQ
jgi:hypothetical protein